jgi:hypothetical protein
MSELATAMPQIAALCVRFATEVDMRNWEAVADCFTPDGTLETVLPPAVMHGRDEIERSLRASAEPGLSAQHLVANHSYEITGERATGHTSFTMFRWYGGDTPPPAAPCTTTCSATPMPAGGSRSAGSRFSGAAC